MLEVQGIHTYYGLSHILFDVSLEVKKGTGRLSAGTQRRRQNHHFQKHHGSDSSFAGSDTV